MDEAEHDRTWDHDWEESFETGGITCRKCGKSVLLNWSQGKPVDAEPCPVAGSPASDGD